MQDAALSWGGDLSPSATGDIALASGTAVTQQRVLRRLLTNAGDYIWHLTYGAGLGAWVGQPTQPASIAATIRSQIFAEAAVSVKPAPAIEVASQPDGSVFASIAYVDATTSETQLLSFSVSA